MTIPADTSLSVDDAMKAFHPSISAELLKIQFGWLVSESKRQHLKIRDIEARADSGDLRDPKSGGEPRSCDVIRQGGASLNIFRPLNHIL